MGLVALDWGSASAPRFQVPFSFLRDANPYIDSKDGCRGSKQPAQGFLTGSRDTLREP